VRKLILAITLCLAFATAQAQALRVVEVSAPAINCLFDPTCRVTVSDTTDTIPFPARGTNFLQSRTFRGQRGSAAEGLFVYEYRIDLRRATGILYVPCLNSLSVDFGPIVRTLDLDGNGKDGDEVFVVTRGGLGSVGLASAERAGNLITFVFSSPVCAGGRPGDGQSTFFFGLVSTHAPGQTTAAILESTGRTYKAQARAPRQIGPRQRQIRGQVPTVGQPIPGQNRESAADVTEAVIHRLSPRPCVDRGGQVTVHGSRFGQQQDGRILELGGHGIGVLLRVRSWSNTRITAIVPDDRRIEYGQWYYIGLQDQDRHWISNISRTITICGPLQ
jgi:hypothetical protein